jgi:hypothetical protein
MPLPAQAVDATQALNRSAGVWKPKVLRGRSLSCRTLSGHAGMSEMCQEATYAVQQGTLLFDHLAGTREQCGDSCAAANGVQGLYPAFYG